MPVIIHYSPLTTHHLQQHAAWRRNPTWQTPTANPYACHNYSLQLADEARREESYRWADRATVAAPHFGAAHLDCVRRLRQVGRPGQAFAEAQYRCREILDRAAAGKLPANDWQAPHHAALLIAFAHLDIGRITEATAGEQQTYQRVNVTPFADIRGLDYVQVATGGPKRPGVPR